MRTHQRHLSFQGSTTAAAAALFVKKTTPLKKVQENKGVNKSLVIRLKIPKKIIHDVFLEKLPSVPALTCDKKRDYIRDNIAKSLSKAAEEVGGGSNKVRDLALSIEIHLHKAWGSCNGPKKQRYLSVLCNLKDEKNPDFRKKVLEGVFAPEHISSLAPMDMASEARKLENQKILDAKREKEIKVVEDEYVMQKD